jgi:hypothetical protein
MIANEKQLRVSLQQLHQLLRALADVKRTVLKKNAKLFATMAEAYVDDIDRIRADVGDYLRKTKRAG